MIKIYQPIGQINPPRDIPDPVSPPEEPPDQIPPEAPPPNEPPSELPPSKDPEIPMSERLKAFIFCALMSISQSSFAENEKESILPMGNEYEKQNVQKLESGRKNLIKRDENEVNKKDTPESPSKPQKPEVLDQQPQSPLID